MWSKKYSLFRAFIELFRVFKQALSGEQSKLETNGPVELVLRFRNLSTNGFHFGIFYESHGGKLVARFSPGFECVVTTPSTNEIKLDLTEPVGSWSRGRAINILPNPNRIGETGLSLSHVFKFDEVGTYKIVAHLALLSPENQKPFTVTSNPLLFRTTSNQ
jgi:hypothetical protein